MGGLRVEREAGRCWSVRCCGEFLGHWRWRWRRRGRASQPRLAQLDDRALAPSQHLCRTLHPSVSPSIALHPQLHRPPIGAFSTMLSRTTACRGAQRAARQLSSTQKRGLAAPASGSFQYQSGEAKGVKFASRDFAGPTTTLALVAKAGTRYQSLPGLTEGLANFAFRVCTPSGAAPSVPPAMYQRAGALLTPNCITVHRAKVDPAHCPRVGASGSCPDRPPLAREPRPRGQVPPR